MRKVGMVIGQGAKGDHGAMLPREFSRGQMQSDSPHKPFLAFSDGESRIFARGCVSLPAYAGWCGVDVALM